MPIENLSPDSIVSIGAYSVTDNEVLAILSDGSDAVDTANIFNNTNGNQLIHVALEDPNGSNPNYVSFTTTIHARKGGKGNATVNIRVISTNVLAALSNHNITVNTADVSVYTTPSTSLSFDDNAAKTFQLQILGTNNTQCFYTEAFVTLTAASSAGKIIISSEGGVIGITEGKITL
jgi:hypothetical protein